MSRVWSACKLLLALAAVGALLFGGAALLLDPGGHGGGNPLAANPVAGAVRDVFDDDGPVIDAVQAAHEEFNAEIWGDGGNLTAACRSLEGAATTADQDDAYDREHVDRIEEVRRRVCDGGGSDMALHDALVDLEEGLRDGGG